MDHQGGRASGRTIPPVASTSWPSHGECNYWRRPMESSERHVRVHFRQPGGSVLRRHAGAAAAHCCVVCLSKLFSGKLSITHNAMRTATTGHSCNINVAGFKMWTYHHGHAFSTMWCPSLIRRRLSKECRCPGGLLYARHPDAPPPPGPIQAPRRRRQHAHAHRNRSRRGEWINAAHAPHRRWWLAVTKGRGSGRLRRALPLRDSRASYSMSTKYATKVEM